MAQWATFVGITGVVLVLLLVLSHLTQSSFSDGSDTVPAADTGTGNRDIDTAADTVTDSDGLSDAASDSDFDSDSDPDPELLPGSRDGIPTDDAPNSIPTGAPQETDESDVSDTSDASETSNTSDVSETSNTSNASIDGPSESNERVANGEGLTDADATPRRARTAADRDSGYRYGTPSERGHETIDPDDLSTGMLLANVALSQGLFAFVLLGAVLYTGIPADALGLEFSRAYLETGVLVGTAAGIVLYAANEIGAALATRFGFDHDEQLRELLAPDTVREWLVLLLAVLPIIAVFEELLFRAALIGVISTGYGIDPWLLAAGSSIAFAVGHGMQGSVGIVVTGLLGFVLAAVFILTGSFLVVVVAHYLINALEFAVHEGLEFDWAQALETAGTSRERDAGSDASEGTGRREDQS